MKTKRIVFVTLVGLAIASAGVFAQNQAAPPVHRLGPMMQGGPGGPGHMGMGPGAALRHLQLTEQQQAQIQQVMQQHHEAYQAMTQKMADLHNQLKQELFADAPDEAKIASLQAAITQLQPEHLAAMLDVQKQISRILTPEQRRQVREAPEMFQVGPGHGPGRQMRHGPAR